MTDQDYDHLAETVAAMRRMQQRYLTERNQFALFESKRLEKKVDAMIFDWNAAKNNQPKVFENSH